MQRLIRIIVSIVSTIAVAVIVIELQEEVASLLDGDSGSAGPKVVTVAEAEEESAVAAYLDKSVKAVKVMLGIKEEDSRSDLARLMDRRRKETAPVTYDFGY